MTTQTETDTILSGVVSELRMQKAGFCAGYLYAGGRRVSFSVKGFVEVNKPASIRGQWENHPRFGRQFKGTEVVYEMPADPDGMAAWLASAVDRMGPVKARKLVDEFGADLPRMLQQNPEQVAIACTLPVEFVRRTAEAWAAAADRANLGTKLYGFGLTQNEVEALIARYKGSAVSILESDPYLILRDLPGFGWKRVDQIGRKVGVPFDHPGRVRAAVITAVVNEYDEGSTCCGRESVLAAASDLLGGTIDRDLILAGLADAIEKRLLVPFGDVGIAASGPAMTERYLWRRFAQGRYPNPVFKRFDADELEKLVQARRTVSVDGTTAELDDSQLEGLRLVARNRFSVITGGAGSGKTLVAKAVRAMLQMGEKAIDAGYRGRAEAFDPEEEDDEDTDLYEDSSDAAPVGSGEPPSIALCAPTGKAARRLAEVIGADASTIHRLLGWNPIEGTFEHNESDPLPYDALIVDEASMIDSALMRDLFRAVGDDTAVVLIGDDNQLPPVGAGYPLRDILEHELVPCLKLAKCHRQAGPLKHNSVRVLDGVVEPSVIDAGDPGPWLVHRALTSPDAVLVAVVKLFSELLPKWEYGDLESHQFITAKHDGQLGTKKLNELLQRLAQARRGVAMAERPPDEYLPLLVGDKVIQTRNNYALGVMNGTIGTVVDDGPLVVKYEERTVTYPADAKGEVQLAYCLTCHKMQGSQVPCIVVICPRAHAFMQHRNWLYTGLTRAMKTAILIGDSDGIRRAAERVETSRRRTVLELFAKVPEVRSE